MSNEASVMQQLRNGTLAGSRQLTLRADLTDLPQELLTLSDSLEELDLNGNQLSELPNWIAQLHKLKRIFISQNQFTELPRVFGQMPALEMIGAKSNRIDSIGEEALPPNLRWLILTENALTRLPAVIGRCTPLQKLMLAGNRLRELPSELQRCTSLELLRISANNLTSLPAWLWQLPKLAWLAFAGNQLSAAHSPVCPPHSISWNDIIIEQQRGSGASGTTYQGRLKSVADEAVAVKVFKGTLTSDGHAADEVAASIAAGSHPALLTAKAVVLDHPQQLPTVILPLASADAFALAQPPSFDTCTRDVYSSTRTFSLGAIERIAQSMADALRHLHERGIMHGDFYAHNILTTLEGDAVLGDFGAASFFGTLSTLEQEGCLAIERRAYQHLCDELLEVANARDCTEIRATEESLQRLAATI